jgi:nucleoside recognition membrane protein YjiH
VHFFALLRIFLRFLAFVLHFYELFGNFLPVFCTFTIFCVFGIFFFKKLFEKSVTDLGLEKNCLKKASPIWGFVKPDWKKRHRFGDWKKMFEKKECKKFS